MVLLFFSVFFVFRFSPTQNFASLIVENEGGVGKMEAAIRRRRIVDDDEDGGNGESGQNDDALLSHSPPAKSRRKRRYSFS